MIHLILTLIFSAQFSFAQEFSRGILHQIDTTRIARKGNIMIQYRDVSVESIELKLNYEFEFRFMMMRRSEKGMTTQEIPADFKEEQGYIDLERDGIYEDDKVRLTHLGRTDWRSYYDCHVIHVFPKSRRANWEAEFTYCPDLPEIGIGKVEFSATNIPIIGNYSLTSQYRRQR